MAATIQTSNQPDYSLIVFRRVGKRFDAYFNIINKLSRPFARVQQFPRDVRDPFKVNFIRAVI